MHISLLKVISWLRKYDSLQKVKWSHIPKFFQELGQLRKT